MYDHICSANKSQSFINCFITYGYLEKGNVSASNKPGDKEVEEELKL